MDLNLEQLRQKALAFRDARNWEQFHTPKNLAAALSVECGELQEIFLWKTDEEVRALLKSEKKKAVAEELADVFMFLLYLSKSCEVDLGDAMLKKLEMNELKYPVSRSYNCSKKYTEFEGERSGAAGAGDADTARH